MKKKVMILFFASAILTSALTGCGCGRGNTGGNTNDNTNINGTEEITQEEFGTETINDTENAGSQMQLGSAVEIPQGFDGQLAETEPHGQLERVIADYCGVAQEDYTNVRYYYNYADLNGDSKNEILALVFGENVTGIDGNVLLWIDGADDDNFTKDSVKQSFANVSAPVFISNHMTEGYRDLIIANYTDAADEAAGNANGNTQADNPDTVQARNQVQPKNAAAAQTGDAQADTTDTAQEGTAVTTSENGTEQPAGTASMGVGYRLLVFQGERYQTLEEGTALDSLDNYEGTAILTNDMERDMQNDNYHFLGEAL
ncbi:MAG: hypothetical protein BHW44_03540 [Roseburia sp. 40_7]|nr:MAG: hypothetical protein BHW44_03540 [Roseburia sp. 40_7]